MLIVGYANSAPAKIPDTEEKPTPATALHAAQRRSVAE